MLGNALLAGADLTELRQIVAEKRGNQPDPESKNLDNFGIGDNVDFTQSTPFRPLLAFLGRPFAHLLGSAEAVASGKFPSNIMQA